ncbi:MAG TPA: hypothetical protein VGE09_11125 [Pseudoxanthomonas sp.]
MKAFIIRGTAKTASSISAKRVSLHKYCIDVKVGSVGTVNMDEEAAHKLLAELAGVLGVTIAKAAKVRA